MEFKFLMFAIMLAIFPIPTEASSKSCPRWVKLNKSPVCFGARGNQVWSFFLPSKHLRELVYARAPLGKSVM